MTTIDNNDLLIQMRHDLFAAYRDVTSKPCPSQRIAWIRTVRHPAPRYYLSTKRASTALCKILQGDTSEFNKLSKLRQQLYQSLYNEVIRLSQLPQYANKPMIRIVEQALKQPAPQFFITWESFRKTFRNAKRYGIDFDYRKAYIENKQYSNRRNNIAPHVNFTGKLHIID